MTVKTATTRLFVAFVSLLIAILALATGLVKLVVTLVTLGVQKLEARRLDLVEKKIIAPTTAMPPAATRPNLRIVEKAPSQADAVAFALKKLGFKAEDVKRFLVTGFDPNASTPDNIKVGLRFFSEMAA
jgi:uncharacterized membrane protein